ncbi:S8 family peptidase [uncultured Pontibacter sp.]|uniref:S8 family peptidase n=1 Tax=uncultured Pontibacter sp. TaxID=453356 RepID=UPI002606F149|nr:S8 family peptidase [uncultured Pontibacter sp.]
MQTNLNHIFLEGIAEASVYRPRQQQGSRPRIPERNRVSHSEFLDNRLREAWSDVDRTNSDRAAVALPIRSGTYLEFKSGLGYDLITKSLEDQRKGIRLLNVREQPADTGDVTYATVYVPRGQESYFLNKVRQYSTNETITGKPKNAPLVNSIDDVRVAFLNALWTDSLDLQPGDNPKWCEAWLRFEITDTDGVFRQENVYNNFISTCQSLGIEVKQNSLVFPERLVLIFKATRDNLIELINRLDTLAEIRAVKETAEFWLQESNSEQSSWIDDLLGRTIFADTTISVCVLDSGVTYGHRLLSPVISQHDCLTVVEAWGVRDHLGHGTLMSGLATYGDLQSSFEGGSTIHVNHKLTSVKILPPSGENSFDLYGSITQQAISRIEIQRPTWNHIYCMAVTTMEQIGSGRPSSWSAAIDQSAFGENEESKRLIIISAGNISDRAQWRSYPDSNLLNSIQDPAQSWNALTVGAYTQKTRITSTSFDGWSPLAQAGELSPYSSTSNMWETTKWPIKPDVVFEGGNLLRDGEGNVDSCGDLGILSTSSRPLLQQFDIISATSAATAQASNMAARIQTLYPDAWPETVRGLIVHSAEWTDQLISQFAIDITRKTSVKKLLRICGYGVPSLDKALFSTSSSLTLIAQEYIQPYDRAQGGSRLITKDMHFFKLPWPNEVLRDLGETQVKVRITLSYFIEPGPGEVGWKDRYRYASHALRFDLNNPSESEEEFIKRVNVAARQEDETGFSDPGSERWVIGKTNRSMGSIHSDSYIDNAANIAACNFLAVYPVIGWWRERKNLDKWGSRTRYSLIVSLITPNQEIDIYTPVMHKVSIPVTIVNEVTV